MEGERVGGEGGGGEDLCHWIPCVYDTRGREIRTLVSRDDRPPAATASLAGTGEVSTAGTSK